MKLNYFLALRVLSPQNVSSMVREIRVCNKVHMVA